MKKRASISFFTLLLLFNLVGVAVIFNVFRHEWKRSIHLELARGKGANALVRLSFHRNAFDPSTYEFEHEGHMYDVVSASVVGDSVHLTVFDDTKEMAMVTEFRRLAFANAAQNADFQSKIGHIFDFLLKDFVPESYDPFVIYPSVERYFRTVFAPLKSPMLCNHAVLEAPPPEV